MKRSITRALFAAGVVLLILPLLLYSKAEWQRPPRTNLETTLFEGITYRREVHETPRPHIIHFVDIDLMATKIEVQVSAGNPAEDGLETTARTTSDFLADKGLQLAVNASYFYPFREKTPWDFYPHSGDRVNVVGEAIGGGERYSLPKPDWPVLCFADSNLAQIFVDGTCPLGTAQAIAGSEMLVIEGNLVETHAKDLPYARVAVAIDKTGKHLWLIVVDGKQPHYSHGVTLAELGQIALDLGADAAINLDGGGSTTLVAATSNGFSILNAPIHTRIPLRERPVANHLGFRAAALE